MIVYLAVNRVNHKAYVGQTRFTLAGRMGVHVHKSRTRKASYFQRAIAKHGVNAFDFAILECCESIPELQIRERYWISKLGCMYPTGYNVSSGGEGASIPGRLKSDKWKAAVTSPQYREAASRRMRLLRASLPPERQESWKRNAAAAHKIYNPLKGDDNPSRRPEVREKIRLSKLGKKRPDMAERWKDPDFRSRLIINLRHCKEAR